MEYSGSELLLRALQREGADTLFGYPGGVLLGLYDAIGRSEVRHILVRHEQAAVHAAEGYARSTGKVGVALATSGPGATNTVTGLVNAMMDSTPLVVLTGQVPTNLRGTEAFQEADILAITKACTKWGVSVERTEDIPDAVAEAFARARSGRPGPCLVDLPKDVLNGRSVERPMYRAPSREFAVHPAELAAATELLFASRRPIAYVGGGVILGDAAPELRALIDRLQIPTVMTLQGLGALPGDHPLSLGMLGMHGGYAANRAVDEADALIALGARFDDRVTGRLDAFAPGAKVIHFDVDGRNLGRLRKADAPVHGAAGEALYRWLEMLEADARTDAFPARTKAWRQTVAAYAEQYRLTVPKEGASIKPQRLVAEIDRLTAGRAIVTTDVGQHQMWVAQHYRFREPRTQITSGGLGTMGFGFPSAIGAAVGNPGRTVVAVTGDGGFQMNLQELATLKRYGLPVKIVIVNNGVLGMIRQWQTFFFDGRYVQSELDDNPDFVALAAAYGISAARVERPCDLTGALQTLLEHEGPGLLDVRVEAGECVFPMIPAGGTVADTIHGPSGSPPVAPRRGDPTRIDAGDVCV